MSIYTHPLRIRYQPDAALFALWREIAELGIDTRDAVEGMLANEPDFEVDNYRFIRDDTIDEIQQEELARDPYILGCFNAWFLADILNVSTDTIEAMQKSEAFEGIGQWIIDAGKVSDLQQSYVSADGYGHHFNYYDSSEEEIGEYHIFRTN